MHNHVEIVPRMHSRLLSRRFVRCVCSSSLVFAAALTVECARLRSARGCVVRVVAECAWIALLRGALGRFQRHPATRAQSAMLRVGSSPLRQQPVALAVAQA